MKHFAKFALLGAALAVSTSSAFATTFTYGGAVAAGTFGVADATYSGLTVSGSGTATASNPNQIDPFTVSYTATVFEGGTGAMCPTCLNFVYTFTNTQSASQVSSYDTTHPGATADQVDSFSVNLFAPNSYTEVADYVTGSGSVATNNAQLIGSSIFFTYASGVTDGQASDTLVVFTNATAALAGGMVFSDGSSLTTPGIEPSGPVGFAPEPSSLMLMGTGLVGAAGMLMRRRQQQTVA
jgi:hypothetical protein